VPSPQVFAFSGMLRTEDDELGNVHLLEHALSLTSPQSRPRVCYLPTALGDADAAVTAQRERFATEIPEADLSVLTLFPQPSVPDVRGHLLAQDLLLVEGGSVVNLMAVWRAHGLDQVMREAWQAGVVLSGVSAGSLCWHLGGPTDSFRDALDPFTDGLGLLPYSNGVHDDLDDQPRRTTYRRLVADGTLPPGYASEDGVGLHYVGVALREAVSVRRGARAWWVDRDGATPVPTRYLGSDAAPEAGAGTSWPAGEAPA
jgi:peptidase E